MAYLPGASPTSPLPGAHSSPPHDKSSNPKGRAGPDHAPTSRLPGALAAPHNHKWTHSKGKAGPGPLQTSKFQGALPLPPQHKYSHPKGKAGPENAPTSKCQDALPPPQDNKSYCSKGTRFAEATAQLPNALPRPLCRLLPHSSAPEQIRQSRGLLTCASLLWPPDALCPRHRPRKLGRTDSPWTLAT